MFSNKAGQLIALSLFIGISVSPSARAQDGPKQPATTPPSELFSMPVVNDRMRSVLSALARKQLDAAAKTLKTITETYPWHMESHYLLASVQAVKGEKEAALDNLQRAIDNGFDNQQALFKDANLASIQKEPRFQKMVEGLINTAASDKDDKALTLPISKPVNGIGMISSQNTFWEPRFEMLWSSFAFNDRKVAPATVQGINDPAAKKLNMLFRTGKAAGNNGDLYDNRDRNHSKLNPKNYPQLTFSQYSAIAQQLNTDYGFNLRILFGNPTFGNSSTALTSGNFWRSQTRLGYTTPGGPQKLYLQHVRNHLYIYPAVQDYDSKEDLIPANTAFLLTTVGKSGSDQPYMRAVAAILAAFKPEVKDQLTADGQLMSAVQMILRRNIKPVQNRDDYLSSKAHPIAFNGDDVNLAAMIDHANKLELGDYPGLPLLKVAAENQPIEGVDNFVGQMPELLFTTPSGTARVVRNSAFEKSMSLTVSPSRNDQKEDVSFVWKVLRGDKNKITIETKSDGKNAQINIKWHDRDDLTIKGHYAGRVEIAVFADNGKELSAPAILNFYYPPYQTREYDESGKLISIDHREPKGAYSDPQLFVKRDWKDTYQYDGKDRLIGWIRERGDEKTEFTYHGAQITQKDKQGRVVLAEQVGLIFNRDEKGRMVIKEKPLGQFLKYEYLDDQDKRGLLIR